MHIDENEQTERLKEFGLPAYATRAYLALLKLGTAEARQVSEMARVPPAKVYGTLEQLQQKGLVQVAPGKPRKYSPVPMAEFLERRLAEHREQMDALLARKDELVDLFPILGTRETGERFAISTIRGRRNVWEHFRERAAAARRDLALLLPAAPAERFSIAGKAITEARARGVRIRLIAHASAEPDPLVAKLEAFPGEVRISHDADLEPHVALATFDGETALLAHFIPGQTSRGHAKDVAILARETALASTLASLLHERWEKAAPHAEPAAPQAPEEDPPRLSRGMADFLVMTDVRDRVIRWSQGAVTAFGVPASDALGRPLESLVPGLSTATGQGETRVRIGNRTFHVSHGPAANGHGVLRFSCVGVPPPGQRGSGDA